MNERLQKSITDIENCIAIQRDCVSYAPADYMRGVLNGLIVAHSSLTGNRPQFDDCPTPRRSSKIRHKSKKG